MLELQADNKSGFTFIEMIIVMGMLALISITLFATLGNGIDIWKRVNQAVKQDDISIFFDRFAGELRNTFEFSMVGFEGMEERISFASLLTTQGLSQVQEARVGEVSYFYDESDEMVIRQVRNYSQIYDGKEGSKQELLENIDSLKFSYYSYDDRLKEYLWEKQWQAKSDEELFPLAVRIELEFEDGNETKTIIRTIDIPIAQPYGDLFS